MIHWQNGPNDRGQALLIAGMFNSQMYMGGVVAVVEVSDVDFVFDTWDVDFVLDTWSVDFVFTSES